RRPPTGLADGFGTERSLPLAADSPHVLGSPAHRKAIRRRPSSATHGWAASWTMAAAEHTGRDRRGQPPRMARSLGLGIGRAVDSRRSLRRMRVRVRAVLVTAGDRPRTGPSGTPRLTVPHRLNGMRRLNVPRWYQWTAVVSVDRGGSEDEDPGVDLGALLERRLQRPVQSVLEVQTAVPLDHVREQVAIEGGVLGEQLVQR